jgi:voltage-gated potassium channel
MTGDNERRKSKIIEAIAGCNNPYILLQMEKIVLRNSILSPLEKMVEEYPLLLEEGNLPDKQLKLYLPPPVKNNLSRYDTMVRPFFFFFSLLMLILAAVILNTISQNPENLGVIIFQDLVVRIYLTGWVIYFLDFSILVLLARKTKTKLATSEFIFRFMAVVFPPIRLASRHIHKVELTWLPFYGWCKSNEGLKKHLRHRFSIPMIVIALLIIPVLLIEWKFYDEISAYLHSDLSFWLDIVQGFIWMAFAFEFILMFSISNDKLEYTKQNWIDVLIILLPFISFIRTMRIIKIARLGQLARGYKLRGLLMKAKQGFIFASFFYRILTLKPNFQIKNIRKKLEKNQQEREKIEEELVELYQALKSK